jgi:hypothetical protein
VYKDHAKQTQQSTLDEKYSTPSSPKSTDTSKMELERASSDRAEKAIIGRQKTISFEPLSPRNKSSQVEQAESCVPMKAHMIDIEPFVLGISLLR